ncbi:MAG: hypothetical protein ACQ9MH_23995 [Nitrospinales bacterium]
MDKRFAELERSRLIIKPLAERKHNLSVANILNLEPAICDHRALWDVASRIYAAKACNSSVVLMMGAHVLRSGVQRYLIDMMERGYISCIAMNGAGVIHDFEFALVGATTESVEHYIRDGQFGLWLETGRINDIVTEAAKNGRGLGEAVGRIIEEEAFPHKNISLLAAGYRLQIPITIHVSIGCDIVHEFPNCNGAAYGETSYTDFLRFAKILEFLEDGVVMNFGSAVMAPEIYLKALAMARNISNQEGKRISKFTTLVCDLVNLPDDYHIEPSRDNPAYYFRPWKTMLVRTVADGGKSFYVQGRHAETITQLWTSVTKIEETSSEQFRAE